MILKDERDMPGASVSQTGLSQQAAEPEVSALTGFDPSRGSCSRACALRQRLDRRIHAQRLANRETWETVDMRQMGHRRFTLSIIHDVGKLLDALGIPKKSPLGGWWTMHARIRMAIATEARRAGTTEIGPVADESAAPQEDAQ